CPCSRCGGWRRGARVTGPHEDAVVLIHRQTLARNEFVLQIFQIGVIELELALEGAIGQASPALEHRYRLVEDLFKVHGHPSLCRCGVQKTVWELARPRRRIYTAHSRQKKAGCPGCT